MKAAIYCRLSKEDEELEKDGSGRESESIQNQKSMLFHYAVEKGYDIYQIYCDEDYSGVDRARPAFNRMIEAAGQHKFDVILAKTQSRFTRDMELVEKYLHGKFIEWGVRFIAIVDHVDTADEANKKSRQINGLVNEWYLEDLSNNVRSVLSHKRREGKFIGSSALYGYQKDPADKNHLVIDPEAAEVVKRIFALYLAGNGTTRIARILNEECVPSPTQYKREHGVVWKRPARYKNEDLWGKATIYRMLTNRSYAGDMEQGRHKKVSYKSKKTVWIPKKDWIVVPGTHEGIIERDSFERVQQMLRAHARGGGRGTVNPLARKVVCGICGCTMEQTASGCAGKKTGKANRYFRCRTSQRDKTRCPGQNYMPMEQLQELVLERTRFHIAGHLKPEWFEAEQIKSEAEQCRQAKREELERLKAEIQRRRKAMQELYLDKSSGTVSSAQFAQMNRAFLDEADRLEKRCVLLEDALARAANTPGQKKTLEHCFNAAGEIKALDRELACLLIRKVVVYPPDVMENTRKIEIDWKF